MKYIRFITDNMILSLYSGINADFVLRKFLSFSVEQFFGKNFKIKFNYNVNSK